MTRRTRHNKNKNIRRTRGGGGKPLRNQKITFTLFVGDDGVYLQKPEVSSPILPNNFKKSGKKISKDNKTVIKTVIQDGLNAYNLDDFKTAYEKKLHADPEVSREIPIQGDKSVTGNNTKDSGTVKVPNAKGDTSVAKPGVLSGFMSKVTGKNKKNNTNPVNEPAQDNQV